MFFLIFLLHFVFTLKETFHEKNSFLSFKNVFYLYKLKLFSLVSKKKIFFLLSSILFIFFFQIFITYMQTRSFTVAPWRGYEGNMFKVSFDIFQNYGRISVKDIVQQFFNGPIDTARQLPITFGITGFFIVFFTLYRIGNFLRNKDFLIIGTLIFLISIFSLFNIYYIDKFVYSLPFFDYYRHKIHILHLVYPFYLLLFYKIFSSKILIQDCNKKYFIISIIFFYIFFVSFFYSKNLNILNIILQVGFLFFFLNYFKKFYLHKFYFTIANFILIITYVCSLTNFISKDKEVIELNNKIHFREKINFSKQNELNCISEISYKQKYSKLIDPIIEKFSYGTYGDLQLLTEEVPCDTFLRFYSWNNYEIWKSKVNNTFPVFSKNFIINKIDDIEYVILGNNNYAGVIPVAFDKNWSLKDKNKKTYRLINNNGFLEINLESDMPSLNLKYNNTLLSFFSKFKFISGFLIVLFFYFIIFFNFKKHCIKKHKKN